MTVADLIAKLQEFPADMTVLTPGFDECGFDPPRVTLETLFRFGDNDYRRTADRSLIKSIGDKEFSEEPAGLESNVVVINF